MLDFGPGSFFLTHSQLADSPSSRHGVSSDVEQTLRFYGCEIIQEACILLCMPQVVAATAQVLFHRFFCKQSFRDFDARNVAASCFWLAMKLEEEEGASNRGRKRSQVNVVVAMFEHIRARREGGQPLPPHSPAFKIRKEELLKLEVRILVEFGFVCNVEHPHKLLLCYLHKLEVSRKLIQESWNLVNDSLRTTLCVCYPSNVVACGIIYAAARRLSVPLPENPPWWLSFDVTFDQIRSVCYILADLYRQPKCRFIDVRNPSSQSTDLASLPKVSAVGSPAKPSEPVVPSPDCPSNSARSADVDCTNIVPVSPSSSSKILNSCFVHASGSPSSKHLVRGDSSKCKKRSRESSCELDRKNSRFSSNSDRDYDWRRYSRRTHSKHGHGYDKDVHRDSEHKHWQHGHHSRCSRWRQLHTMLIDEIPAWELRCSKLDSCLVGSIAPFLNGLLKPSICFQASRIPNAWKYERWLSTWQDSGCVLQS